MVAQTGFLESSAPVAMGSSTSDVVEVGPDVLLPGVTEAVAIGDSAKVSEQIDRLIAALGRATSTLAR